MEPNVNNLTISFIESASNSSKPIAHRFVWAFHPRDPLIRNVFVDTDKLDVHSQYWESITLVPILATVMLAVTVFLLVLFRQTPTLVAATVAATLTIIGIYLILSSITESRPKYE
ncbi:uncharacterized protein LOC112904951 [Agrilus planipennis]|uniref:Uncharacterized protein LOC112904951 n=1 Tax=Agrilus planipennis TaxID=224129 RepID=A0A7F5R7W7_AGRPL|nr:uncharacterized protein LOC112904951 [Agrilus planipennis]